MSEKQWRKCADCGAPTKWRSDGFGDVQLECSAHEDHGTYEPSGRDKADLLNAADAKDEELKRLRSIIRACTVTTPDEADVEETLKDITPPHFETQLRCEWGRLRTLRNAMKEARDEKTE